MYAFSLSGWKLVRDGTTVAGRNCDVDGDGGEPLNLTASDLTTGVGFFEYWQIVFTSRIMFDHCRLFVLFLIFSLVRCHVHGLSETELARSVLAQKDMDLNTLVEQVQKNHENFKNNCGNCFPNLNLHAHIVF